MEKEFVTIEISKRLASIGFDERCLMYWMQVNNNDYASLITATMRSINDTPAPMYTQAFDWLSRKKGRIANIIYDNEYNSFFWEYCYVGGGFRKSFLPLQHDSEGEVDYDFGRFDDYYSAANSCIERMISDIENNIK